MKALFSSLIFWGLTICLFSVVKESDTDVDLQEIEFVPAQYGSGNSEFLRDLWHDDRDVKMDTTKADEFITRLSIKVLITKDGIPKVLSINGKDRSEESLMNRLESYVMHKMESKAMNKWKPAYIFGTPIDYVEIIPIIM
ncbi:MAG: hypothetical protein K2I64_00425 [Muribaculaceae bacterium]|nr:hypothetical protein [Muribaculaceae bacterium]